MSLENKVALITGGSSGIGAAIAIKFTQEGAKVAIVGRNRDKLKNVSDICEKHGKKPLIIIADFTKEPEIQTIVSETVNHFGKLDILINNAGIANFFSILDSTAIDAYKKIMTTNLDAAVLLTHLAAKHIVENKGNIVNISSVAGISVVKDGFAYCTSKAGLDHFTRSIAFELAPKGVRVNSVNPGPVRTDILDYAGKNANEIDTVWDSLKKLTLLDRVADAEEIADLVAFVVSDKGRSITGAILVSDNGAVLKGSADVLGN